MWAGPKTQRAKIEGKSETDTHGPPERRTSYHHHIVEISVSKEHRQRISCPYTAHIGAVGISRTLIYEYEQGAQVAQVVH